MSVAGSLGVLWRVKGWTRSRTVGPIFQISNVSENLGHVAVIAFKAFKTGAVSTLDEGGNGEEG